MKKATVVRFFLIILTLGFSMIFLYRRMTNIYRPFPELAQTVRIEKTTAKPIYFFGVISRFPPTFIYRGYQPVMDYLTQNTPYRFELKLSKSYKQTVEQLARGRVVAAFLGSFIFTKEAESNHLKCILRPLSSTGKPYLRAVLFTKSSSKIKNLSDLRGKKVALPSPLSFSANWFRFDFLPQHGIRPSQLDSLHCFAHHYTVIYEVLKGKFEAGVVKDRVAHEFLNRGIRILARSAPMPSSPIVISQKSPAKVVEAIKKALLKINPRKPYFKKLLSTWDAEFAFGFAPAKNKDYRVLQSLVKASEKP